MGRRLKAVDELLQEERRRQENNLSKMIKQRQKKNVQKDTEELEKQTDELEAAMEKVKSRIDEEKARTYAENGSHNGLLDSEIVKRRDKISSMLDKNFDSFQNDLTAQEEQDFALIKQKLNIDKRNELKKLEKVVEEELGREERQRADTAGLEVEKDRLTALIAEEADPIELNNLMEQVAFIDQQIHQAIHDENMAQNEKMNLRRKVKADRMQIKKLRIERDQLEHINEKEL